MIVDKLLLTALRRFARGFLLAFLGLFVTATVVSLLANLLQWPSFTIGAGNISIYSFSSGTNGLLGVGAFHIAMFVGLISGALAFRNSTLTFRKSNPKG